MPEVVDVDAPGDLAGALASLAEDVADLGDVIDAPAADDLDEDLVAERGEGDVRDRRAAKQRLEGLQVKIGGGQEPPAD